MSHKLVVKFRNYEELLNIQAAARYLNMTDKEFMRAGAMSLIRHLNHEIETRTAKLRADAEAQQAEMDKLQLDAGAEHERNNSEEVTSSATEGELPSSNPGSESSEHAASKDDSSST